MKGCPLAGFWPCRGAAVEVEAASGNTPICWASRATILLSPSLPSSAEKKDCNTVAIFPRPARSHPCSLGLATVLVAAELGADLLVRLSLGLSVAARSQ